MFKCKYTYVAGSREGEIGFESKTLLSIKESYGKSYFPIHHFEHVYLDENSCRITFAHHRTLSIGFERREDATAFVQILADHLSAL